MWTLTFCLATLVAVYSFIAHVPATSCLFLDRTRALVDPGLESNLLPGRKEANTSESSHVCKVLRSTYCCFHLLGARKVKINIGVGPPGVTPSASSEEFLRSDPTLIRTVPLLVAEDVRQTIDSLRSSLHDIQPMFSPELKHLLESLENRKDLGGVLENFAYQELKEIVKDLAFSAGARQTLLNRLDSSELWRKAVALFEFERKLMTHQLMTWFLDLDRQAALDIVASESTFFLQEMSLVLLAYTEKLVDLKKVPYAPDLKEEDFGESVWKFALRKHLWESGENLALLQRGGIKSAIHDRFFETIKLLSIGRVEKVSIKVQRFYLDEYLEIFREALEKSPVDKRDVLLAELKGLLSIRISATDKKASKILQKEWRRKFQEPWADFVYHLFIYHLSFLVDIEGKGFGRKFYHQRYLFERFMEVLEKLTVWHRESQNYQVDLVDKGSETYLKIFDTLHERLLKRQLIKPRRESGDIPSIGSTSPKVQGKSVEKIMQGKRKQSIEDSHLKPTTISEVDRKVEKEMLKGVKSSQDGFRDYVKSCREYEHFWKMWKHVIKPEIPEFMEQLNKKITEIVYSHSLRKEANKGKL